LNVKKKMHLGVPASDEPGASRCEDHPGTRALRIHQCGALIDARAAGGEKNGGSDVYTIS